MEYKDGKGRLIVDNMSEDEASKFTCVAQNVAGEAQTAAAVTVTGEFTCTPTSYNFLPNKHFHSACLYYCHLHNSSPFHRFLT